MGCKNHRFQLVIRISLPHPQIFQGIENVLSSNFQQADVPCQGTNTSFSGFRDQSMFSCFPEDQDVASRCEIGGAPRLVSEVGKTMIFSGIYWDFSLTLDDLGWAAQTISNLVNISPMICSFTMNYC